MSESMPDPLADVGTRGGTWTAAPAASAAVIDALSRSVPREVPRSYFAFLAGCNGGEGSLGVEPGWIVFWSAERVDALNREYEVFENLPGFYGFGSNGGGELLAFDLRVADRVSIAMVPFIPMDPDEARVVADDFTALLAGVGRPSCSTDSP